MHVLVADDDADLRDALRRALTFDGHEVTLATDGESTVRAVVVSKPDVVVLDLMMPNLDGLGVCRHLRGTGDHTPVLMLTARGSVADRVAGLDAGADDYLVKPFALDELLARLRALGRRGSPNDGGVRTFDDVTIESFGIASRAGVQLNLTRTEFTLLELFVDNPGRVLSREVIFDRVWGYDFGPESNSPAVYVGYLRRKLEAGGHPRLIHTVLGFGYVLRLP